MKFRPIHLPGLLLWLALLVPVAGAEEITVRIDASSPAGQLPTWFEPSMFAQWNPPAFIQEFLDEAGGETAGMIRLGIENELGFSTDLDVYRAYLDASDINTKVRAVADAGGKVLLVIAKMPIWISSYTGSPDDRVCGDWRTFQTYPPAADKWDEWEEVVYETVLHFNVEMGFTHVRYELLNEPDIGCHWNGTQDEYLELWRRTVAGAERADPAVRLGGTSSNGGPGGRLDGETMPLLQAFLETSAAEDLEVDLVTFHTFGYPPYVMSMAVRVVDQWLAAYGFEDAEMIITEYNPRDAILDDPSWPTPPSPSGRQVDSEMGAAYFLSAMAYLAKARPGGYQCMAHLTNFDYTEEFPEGSWGARTNWSLSGTRKAAYHAHRLPGHMVRRMVRTDVTESNSGDEYFPHFHALGGAGPERATVLVWNYVSVPVMDGLYTLGYMGYGNPDLARWGGLDGLRAFFEDLQPVEALSADSAEQADLERAKRAYKRQQELVTETHRITLEMQGLASTGGYHLTRYLIDDTHSNAYHHFRTGGLPAAVANQHLEVAESRHLDTLADIGSFDLKPYAVSFLEITVAGVGEATNLAWEDRSTFHWLPAPGAMTHDIVKGDLVDLRQTGLARAAAISCSHVGVSAVDAALPPRGTGWYYLVRGRSGADAGTWGAALRDGEITACP